MHLLAEVARVAREQQGYGNELAGARKSGDATAEFAAASRLYRDRGLSLDTSILPGFALERALIGLRDSGLMARGSVRDVAVIGPGLDFADKTSGYDFYPLQTLQPFVLIDSLIRLGLAEGLESVRLTTLDLSPRVNGHLSDARERASKGLPYSFECRWTSGFRGSPSSPPTGPRPASGSGRSVNQLVPRSARSCDSGPSAFSPKPFCGCIRRI